MRNVEFYSARQFSIFRIVFGSFLLFHFVSLILYSRLLFGCDGIIPLSLASEAAFPNVLNFTCGPLESYFYPIVLAILCLLFIIGFQRPIISLLIWYGWVAGLQRNPYIANVSTSYVSWLLLACSLVPKGEPWSFGSPERESWAFPQWVYWGAWVVLATGYSLSGIHKFFTSPSWTEGSALQYFMEMSVTRRSWVVSIFHELPQSMVALTTWLALAIEISFAPFCFFFASRRVIWTLAVIMHLAILFSQDFAEVSITLLLFHLFVFDRRWLPLERRSSVLGNPGTKRRKLEFS